MALYQSGFKPAGGYSIEDARAQQQEQAAKQHALQMQRQTFQWEFDKRKDNHAKTSMYEFFNTQSRKYDPNHLLENMLKSRQPGVPAPKIEQVRGFTADKKQEAFDAYKRIAVNPDINWFEEMWANSKAEEDKKIAMELIQDYNVGKITEKEFNLASRNQNFQDWYRKAKLDDETAGALADIYKPGYSTFSETFFGREDAPGQAGQNIIMRNLFPAAGVGAATAATAAGVAKVMKDKTTMKSAEEALKKATDLAKAAEGKYKVVEKAGPKATYTFKDAGTSWSEAQKTPGYKEWLKKKGLTRSIDNFNQFASEQFDITKRHAEKGLKSAQDKMKLLEKKGLVKRVGKLWTKLPGFARGIGMFGALLAAEPIAKGLVKTLGGSEKAGETAGLGVRTGIGAKFTYSQAKRTAMNALKKSGAPRMADNLNKIIKKKGWKWFAKKAVTKSPGLLAKVAAKAGLGAAGGVFTGGVFAAAMAAMTAADLAMLINTVMKDEEVL